MWAPAPLRRLRHLPRYRQVLEVLARHGFGALLEALEVHRRVPLPRWLLRARPEPELTPAQHLRLALEELGPTFIKLGQVLSTRPDVLPPEFIRELTKLQDAAPPLPWEAVRQVLEEEWGRPPEALLAHVDPQPLAAASLAQVHAAVLPSGEEVVVKVQRPGIFPQIQLDLDILRDLASLAQRTTFGEIYQPLEVVEDFAQTLRNELDYRLEGHNAERFRRNFAQEPHLYIPRVYWEYTTNRVIVLERVRGVRIDDPEGMARAGIDPKKVALHAARIVVKEALEDGFFHADPHPGNFFVMPGEVIAAMDFGMVGHLPREVRLNLIRLYIVSVRMDTARIVEQLIRMGAADTTVDRHALARDLHRLLSRYYGRPLKDIRARQVIEDMLPIVFRHRLRFPPDLWLLGKTLMMMEGVALTLDPDFDFFAVSEPFVARLSRKMLHPATWGPSLLGHLEAWEDFLAEFPRAGVHLLRRLEREEAPITLAWKSDPALTHRLERLSMRLALSIVAAGLGLSLSILWHAQAPLWLLALTAFLLTIVTLWWLREVVRR